MKVRLVRFTSMVVAVCGLVAGLASGARAADPVTMEVASPLMLTAKPLSIAARVGRWFPVAVTLSNTADAVQGRLTLRLIGSLDGGTPNSEFYADVDLPANASRKRVWLYARLEREDAGEMQIVFQGRGFRTLKASGQVRALEPQERSVLTISDVDEKLNYIKSLTGPGLSVAEEKKPDANMGGGNLPNGTANPQLISTLGATHELIPPRWIGLDAIDLVVLHDFPHTSLTPAQLSTLRGYVAGGGSLLALGGTDWQRLAKSPLADLWPLTPTSSQPASNSEVDRLVQKFVRAKYPSAGDRLGGAPVVLLRGTLRPDAIDSNIEGGGSDVPLLTRRNVGAGYVLSLAADPTKPPFLGWSGNAELWSAIFSHTTRVARMEGVDTGPANDYNYNYSRPGSESGTSVDSGLTTALLQALASAKQLKTPPVSFIAWFLALYVFFLVPVNYIVLRYFDKRELAWVTIPVIVVAFSVMSYAAALKIKGNSILMRQVNIVQGAQGSGVARADAMLWLFSPRKTTYDVSSKDAGMAVADYVDNEQGGSSVGTIHQPDEASPFTLENAAINMWDSRSFVGSSIVNVGSGVTLSESGGKIVLQNKTGHNLKGAVLVGAGRLATLGEIKQDATATPQSVGEEGRTGPSLADAIADKSRVHDFLPDEERENFRNIARALVKNAVAGKYSQSRKDSLFVAWSELPAAPLTIGYDDARARSLSLYVFRLHDDGLVKRFVEQKLPSGQPVVPPPPAAVRR